MTPLLLLLVAALASGASVPEGRSYVNEARCWAGDLHTGEWYDFNNANPHLGSIGFDNTIQSIKVTGMWLFYDHENYNSNHPDPTAMYWAFGIDYSHTLPLRYKNIATSLRPVGSSYELNEDSWSVYQGLYFAGETFFGTNEMTDLSFITYDVSSIIVIGKSGWIFCEGLSFTGMCLCFTPDTGHAHEYHKELDVGIYEKISMLSVKSIRKGC